MAKALGRHVPPDWRHVEKYPLDALEAADRPSQVPVAIGVNWYTAFDNPHLKQGPNGQEYWVAEPTNLGTIRGGHCVCLEPGVSVEHDPRVAWWIFYNQGDTPMCIGHGHARMQGLVYRHRFDAVWLYNECKKIDGMPGEDGSTNRAAMEVLQKQGLRIAHGSDTLDLVREEPVRQSYGVAAYRWATSIDDILAALGTPGLDHVVLLNSWGEDYPHRVHMPATTLARLLREDGEAGIATEK